AVFPVIVVINSGVPDEIIVGLAELLFAPRKICMINLLFWSAVYSVVAVLSEIRGALFVQADGFLSLATSCDGDGRRL
ncbi:MAG: hypothetical protein ACYTEQ_31045, partial [Planctomycetota bacterium]